MEAHALLTSRQVLVQIVHCTTGASAGVWAVTTTPQSSALWLRGQRPDQKHLRISKHGKVNKVTNRTLSSEYATTTSATKE